MSIFKRRNYIKIDDYGIDPLEDKALNAIDEIETYQLYTVTAETAENAPLIAYYAYNDKDAWWIIQAYNGILSYKELQPGLQIKIPDVHELSIVLSESNTIEKTGYTEF